MTCPFFTLVRYAQTPTKGGGFLEGCLALTYIIWLSFQMTLSSHLYWSIKSFVAQNTKNMWKSRLCDLVSEICHMKAAGHFFFNLFGAEATFIVCLYHTIQHLWKISWWKRREVQRMKAFLSRSWKASVQLLSVGNNHFLIFTMYDGTESRLRGLPDEEHTFETHDRTLRILTLPFLGTFFQVFCQVGWVFPVLMHEDGNRTSQKSLRVPVNACNPFNEADHILKHIHVLNQIPFTVFKGFRDSYSANLGFCAGRFDPC